MHLLSDVHENPCTVHGAEEGFFVRIFFHDLCLEY